MVLAVVRGIVPSRAAHTCPTPWCPNIVPHGGECPVHPRPGRQQSPEQRKFYSSTRWRRLSQLVRKQEPFCSVCKAKPSTQVHHRDNDWSNNERSNLAGICGECHQTASGKQHRRKQG